MYSLDRIDTPMPPAINASYETFTDARSHFKDAIDEAQRGRIVTVRRDGELTALIAVDRLRDYFFRTVDPRVAILREGAKVVALMDGRPFVAEGADVDSAIDDLAESLREYADDWDSLQHAPNHAPAWALVQLVRLSTDEQLREWLEHGGE